MLHDSVAVVTRMRPRAIPLAMITMKKTTHCRISYREGLGTSLCIMGLTTQDPYIQKEHTELYKILKFRVNWANIEQDTAVQKLQNLVTNVWIAGHLSGNPYISLQILKFLNGCILFNIGPINTKLKESDPPTLHCAPLSLLLSGDS